VRERSKGSQNLQAALLTLEAVQKKQAGPRRIHPSLLPSFSASPSLLLLLLYLIERFPHTLCGVGRAGRDGKEKGKAGGCRGRTRGREGGREGRHLVGEPGKQCRLATSAGSVEEKEEREGRRRGGERKGGREGRQEGTEAAADGGVGECGVEDAPWRRGGIGGGGGGGGGGGSARGCDCGK